MFAGIFFIVVGLTVIYLRRPLAEGQVAFREKTKGLLAGYTTQQRQEGLILVMGWIVVGLGVLFLFVALFRAL